jgi:membrane-associated phospholipid phosphatase
VNARLGASATLLLCAVAYTLLGLAVAHVAPQGIDLAARALAGKAPHLALVFTASCWLPVLVSFGVLEIVLAVRVPPWRGRSLFAALVMLVGWRVSDALKDFFMRPRPPYWLLHHETSYAYSSGHAMFAVIVYFLWAAYVWRSTLPTTFRRIATPVLILWGCGVIWSRLALGAHYPSDLLGGALLGCAFLAGGVLVTGAVAPRRQTSP